MGHSLFVELKNRGALALRKLKLFHQLVAFFATKSSDPKPSVFLGRTGPSTLLCRPPPTHQFWVVSLRLCFLCAAISYLVGSVLYPGGSYHNAHAAGFDHWHNYLCDLWAEHPHGHVHNAARPWGIATVFFLSAALTPLSLIIWRLTARTSPRARAVSLLLMTGTPSGCLVFTPFHDLAIEVGFIPTSVGYLLSLFALGHAGYLRLAWLGLWPLGAAVLNFALWITGAAPFFTPLVQKFALLGLLTWALLASAVRNQANGHSDVKA